MSSNKTELFMSTKGRFYQNMDNQFCVTNIVEFVQNFCQKYQKVERWPYRRIHPKKLWGNQIMREWSTLALHQSSTKCSINSTLYSSAILTMTAPEEEKTINWCLLDLRYPQGWFDHYEKISKIQKTLIKSVKSS